MPSIADKNACTALKDIMPNPLTHPNTFNWFGFVTKFPEEKQNQWPKEAKKEEDDMGLFDSGDDDDEASFNALCEAKKEAIDKANAKKKPTAKSLILWEVKPVDSDTNLDDLAKKIMSEIQMEGLFWKEETKKEPVAFGVFKLIIGAVIEDDKVSTDDIAETI